MKVHDCPNAATLRMDCYSAPRRHGGRLMFELYACREHGGDLTREHAYDTVNYPNDAEHGHTCGHVQRAAPSPDPVPASEGGPMIETTTVRNCPNEAVWVLEERGANGLITHALLACAFCAERLQRDVMPGESSALYPAPPGKPCGRLSRWMGDADGIIAEIPADDHAVGDGDAVRSDNPAEGGGILVSPDPDMPDRTPYGDASLFTVVSAVGGHVLGMVTSDESGERWIPAATIAGRDVVGPPCESFGEAVLWVVARLTVILDGPQATAGAVSPLDVLSHGYKRKGAVWQSGYK